jgi:hypothetical protein
MKLTNLSAAFAGLSLVCGTALAQSEPVQIPDTPGPEAPSMIIIEVQPGESGETPPPAVQQALIEMLLQELLANVQPEDDRQESQIVVPSTEPGVGI